MAAVELGARARRRGAGDVERFVHGMTVGTNALLEGCVARTALLATEGFTDLEELGRQTRAELYRLCAGHPPPLVPGRAAPRRARAHRARRRAAPLDEHALRAASRAPSSTRPPSACSGAFAIPNTSSGGELLARAPARRARLHLERDRRRVPRVRALRHNRGGRRALAAAARLPRRLTERARAEGLPEPEVMLSSGGTATGDRRAPRAIVDRPLGPGRRRGQRGARGERARRRRARLGLDMGGTSATSRWRWRRRGG